MNSLPPDPWKTLGLDQHEEDPGRVKAAYRKLVLRCHPDKVQDPTLKAQKQDEFHRVQQAYELLSDDKKKGAYLDQLKLKELQEKLRKEMPSQAAAATRGSTSKTYTYEYGDYNVRTAEPPPSFKPGPAPGSSPYSNYSGGHQYSSSWEREIPTRSTRPIYEEDRKARKTASYEKPSRREEDAKEERRRRKEKEEDVYVREKDKDRRRTDKRRDDEREREKERLKAELKDQKIERERAEKEVRKAEKKRLERENEKERDRQRRRDHEEKYRTTKKPAVYAEHLSESEEEIRLPAKPVKKTPTNSKKHSDSPPREKSSRRERLERPEQGKNDKHEQMLNYAADYMENRRKGSKSGPTMHYAADPATYSAQYPDPDDAWHPSDGSRRSYDEKNYTSKGDPLPDMDGPETVHVTPADRRPPQLAKSYTSPVGSMPIPTARTIPHLGRSQTMQPDYGRRSPPEAVPVPDGVRYTGAKHSSERRGRNQHGSFELDDDMPRRSSAASARSASAQRASIKKVYVVENDDERSPRVVESPRYRKVGPEEAAYYTTAGTASYNKVKVSPTYNPDHVYVTKRYTDDDVLYSQTPPQQSRSYGQYAY